MNVARFMLLCLLSWVCVGCPPPPVQRAGLEGANSKSEVLARVRANPKLANLGLRQLLDRGELCGDVQAATQLLDAGASAKQSFRQVIYEYGQGRQQVVEQPLFWRALERCNSADLAALLIDRGADPTEHEAIVDPHWPDTRFPEDVEAAAREATMSWLGWFLERYAHAAASAAQADLVLATYLRIAVNPSSPQARRAANNLRTGGRPLVAYFASLCAGRCRPEKAGLMAALAELGNALDSGGVVEAMVPAIDEADVALAEAIAASGVDLMRPLQVTRDAAGHSIVPPHLQDLRVADVLDMSPNARAASALGSLFQVLRLGANGPKERKRILAANGARQQQWLKAQSQSALARTERRLRWEAEEQRRTAEREEEQRRQACIERAFNEGAARGDTSISATHCQPNGGGERGAMIDGRIRAEREAERRQLQQLQQRNERLGQQWSLRASRFDTPAGRAAGNPRSMPPIPAPPGPGLNCSMIPEYCGPERDANHVLICRPNPSYCYPNAGPGGPATVIPE